MSVFSENITSNLLSDFSEEDKTFIRANIERNLLDFSLSSQLTERQKDLIQQISKRQKVKNKLPMTFSRCDKSINCFLTARVCTGHTTTTTTYRVSSSSKRF